MNVSESGWGIFIRKVQLPILLNTDLETMESRYDAWMLAMKVLVAHEYFHYLSQYHCDRLSIDTPKEDKYLRYLADWMKSPKDGVEEAVANAFALNKIPKSGKEDGRRWFDALPHPYSDYKPFESATDFMRKSAPCSTAGILFNLRQGGIEPFDRREV